MKAVVYDRYGPPEGLELREVPKPEPKAGDVLIRVHAASLNSWDWDLVAGNFQGRIGSPFKPGNPTLGADVAGIVEAVGSGVTRFEVGDAVFGDISGCGWGALAEHVCAAERVLVAKPAAMSFVQAAAIPQAGLLALQGLRRNAIRAGSRVLINGAGGGVGSFAIQMAKLAGAEVTGVDAGSKLDFMRSVGADHVIDYTARDFTAAGEQYDLILDVVARRPLRHYLRALRPGGGLVAVGGTTGALLGIGLLGPLFARAASKRAGLLFWHASTDDLEQMKELFEAGQVVPVIDRTYPLAETADAFRRLGAGQAQGKLVVTVADGP